MALEAINLTVGYPGRAVVSGISRLLPEGALTVLVGANGSGKSTLLRTLTGAQPPLHGRVELDGRDIASYKAARLARHLSLVLTDRMGGGGLLVEELVSIGRHPYSGFLGRMSADDRRAVRNAIRLVGLDDKAGAFVASLSDGERQKAMIARAIAQDTDLIVLDEPTSFLDVSSRFEIMDLLGRLAAEEGKTVLLSTHDIAPAISVATNIWAISQGQLVSGPIEQLEQSGALNQVYRGVEFDPTAKDFRRIRQL